MTVPARISLYLLVFIVCWFPDIVVYVVSVYVNAEYFVLMGISYTLLLQGQGFFNVLVFGLTNQKFRQLLKNLGPLKSAAFILLSPILMLPLFAVAITKWRQAENAETSYLIQWEEEEDQ
jgi:hypothetical protein